MATSDGDFERRAEAMDIYDAVVVDPWTWAGKGKAKTVEIMRDTGYHVATGFLACFEVCLSFGCGHYWNQMVWVRQFPGQHYRVWPILR